jgi:hypothetical protein
MSPATSEEKRIPDTGRRIMTSELLGEFMAQLDVPEQLL